MMSEVIAEGEESSLLKLVNFLKKGPEHAHVKKVNVSWYEFQDQFESFSIKGW